MDLKANTAVDVLIGPFVDKTDGNTTEDALTLTQAEIKLSKNGQALTLKSDATAAAFDDDGYYNCELDATDTNTEGSLVLIVHQSANALPVRHEYNVLAEAAWDSLYVAKDTGFMDVDVKAISTSATAANNLETVALAYSAERGLAGTALPIAVADAAGGLPISIAGGLDLDAMNTAAVRLSAARAQVLDDWINAGRLDAILDLVLADTGELQTNQGNWLTATGFSTHDAAAVKTAIEAGGSSLALIKAVTDALTAAAAATLATAAGTMQACIVDTVVNTHTPTTTVFQSDTITQATADHYNGRIVIFTSGVLQYQATDITDYVAVGGIGQFTVTAMTEAPSNNDTFIII